MAVTSGTASFPDGFIYPYHVWDFLRPTFYCPMDLERVGRPGDGGKWVCGMSRYQDMFPPLPSTADIQSDDSSFEAALLGRTNAEIWGWDFSVDGWAGEIHGDAEGRAHFEKTKLGPKTDRGAKPEVWTIADLMARNGHDFVDVMKIDVEGEEWEALGAWMDSLPAGKGGEEVLPVGQMLIEFHLLDDGSPPTPRSLQELLKWWERLEGMGMRPVYNEHNWIGDVGRGRPRFIEYTLINVRHGSNRLLFD
ncbi:hypothetical protein KVT40_006438 [Elsinoe batatas]|uniref:Methyltransferase domain-containing protein n=1 Tax=Elsinoe batatas TaxID=2601811 RepID=A0A8K0KYU5_9PEZI|nr:hypothetical protein KVT40_006438 [Elsinoe batatas]